MRVRTNENLCLGDDDFVAECMKKLMDRYPEIDGYLFERDGDEHIQIIIYGENFHLTESDFK